MNRIRTWKLVWMLVLALVLALAGSAALAELPDAPTLTLDADQLTRGEFLTCTLDGAEDYIISIMDGGETLVKTGGWWSGDYVLPTAQLPAGTYTVQAISYDGGVESEPAEARFTVEEPSDTNLTVRFSATEFAWKDSCVVSACAPGAQRVELFLSNGDMRASDGAGLDTWLQFDEDGQQTCYVAAYYPDGTYTLSETYTITQTSEGGIQGLTVQAPVTAHVGEDYTIAFSGAVNPLQDGYAPAYVVTVTDHTDEDQEVILADEHFDQAGSYTVAGSRLQANHVYTVSVRSEVAQNVRTQYFEQIVTAVDSADGRVPTLTVNGSAGLVETPGGNEEIHISAPGATAVRFAPGWGTYMFDLRSFDTWEESWRDDPSDITFTWEWVGNYGQTTYAAACYDEDPDAEDAQWVLSESVIVRSQSQGTLPMPQAEFAGSVARGEYLSVTMLNMPEQTEEIYVALVDALTDEIYYENNVGPEETFLVPTADVPGGSIYKLRLAYMVQGWDRIDANLLLVVEESDEIAFHVNKSEVITCEDYGFSAYVPGAEGIRVYENGEPFDQYGPEFDYCDDPDANHLTNWWIDHWSAGVYEYTLEYYMDGQWQFCDQPCVVEVNAPEGDLDQPEFNSARTLVQGEELVITVYPVEDAAEYGFSVQDLEAGEDEFIYWEDLAYISEETQITLDADRFELGHSYRVYAFVTAPGWNESDYWYDVTVIDQSDGSVALTVNGGDADIQAISNEEMDIRVSAPGASSVQLWARDEWQDLERDASGSWYTFPRYAPGSYDIVARATYDEIDDDTDWDAISWSAYSNIVHIDVEAQHGAVALPTLTLADDSVAQGGFLTIEVGDFAEGIRRCDVRVRGANGDDDWDEYAYMEIYTGGEYGLSTINLEPGRRYRVALTVLGMPGWDDVETEFEDEALRFDVTEGAEDEALLLLSKYQVLTREPVAIEARVPGAREIRVLVNGVDMYSSSGDTLSWWVFSGSAGEMELSMEYIPEGGDEWVDSGLTRVLNVDAPNGRLDPPVVECPDLVNVGEDVTITVTPPEGGAMLNLWVADTENWEDVYRWDCDSEWITESKTFTIPAEALQVGVRYRAWVGADALGYSDSDGEDSFMVLPLDEEAISLSIDGEDSFEGLVWQEISFTLQAPGATAAQLYFDGSWQDIWNDEGDLSDITWYGSSGVEESTVIARATYDEITEETDWGAINWSAYSNTVHVSLTRLGEVGAVSAELDANEVARGEQITVTMSCEDDSHADHYDVLIYGTNDSDSDDNDFNTLYYMRYGLNEIPHSVSTAILEPGDYRVRVEVIGEPGYDGAGTDDYDEGLRFTVTDAESDFICGLGKGEILQDEDVELWYYVPGAAWVDMRALDSRGDERRCWQYDGESVVDRTSFGEEAGNYELSFTAHYVDEHGEETGEREERVPYTIVTYGQMNAPVIDAPVGVRADEDFTFSVSGLEEADGWWWDVSIHDLDIEEGDDVIWRATLEDDPSASEWTLPAGTLTAGGRYRITAWIDQAGWDGAEGAHNFYVYDEADDNVTLTINGSAGPINAWLSERINLEATAPGAYALLMYNGSDWCYMGQLDPENAVMRWDDVLDPENVQYLVRACYDGSVDWDAVDRGEISWNDESIAWGGISNVVLVNVKNSGMTLDSPSFTIDESVVRGEMLHYGIDRQVGATRYRFRLVNEYGDEEDCVTYYDDEFPGEWSRATGELEAGAYTARLSCSGIGYDWSEETEHAFEITEPTDAVTFSISKTEGLIKDEPFALSAYAPNAASVELIVHRTDEEQDDEVSGYEENWINDNRALNAGAYEMYVVAYYEDGDTAESSRVTVQVGTLGALEPCGIDGSEYFPAGEDYVFTVSGLEQGEDYWWSIDVFDDDMDSDDHCIMTWNRDISAIEESWAIPAELLVPGHHYSIGVWVDANGYEGAGSNLSFSVYGLLEAVNESCAIWYGEDVSFVVTEVEGADSYELCFDNTGNLDGDWHPVAGYELDGPGAYTVQLDGEALQPGAVYEMDYVAHVGGVDMRHPAWRVAVVDPAAVLTLPGDLAVIEEEAFAGVSAQMIVVPEGVTEIRARAFADCPNLIAVILPDGVSVDDSAFEGSDWAIVTGEVR